MGLELVLELVAQRAKTQNGENPTFWKFYFFENGAVFYVSKIRFLVESVSE